MRNRAMPVVVIQVTPERFVVHDPDRDRYLHFDREGWPMSTGTAADDAPQPRLVPVDNPRAVELDRRRQHRAFRDEINEAASEFQLHPTEENLAQLHAVTTAWGAHSIGLKIDTPVQQVLAKQGLAHTDIWED